MFTALDTLDEGQVKFDKEEVEVDMEGELIRVLGEIQRLVKRNKKKKEMLLKFEKEKDNFEDSSLLLLQVKLDEARIIEYSLL